MTNEMKQIVKNCLEKAEELKSVLEKGFNFLRQNKLLITVEVEEFEVSVNVDGEFIIYVDYKEDDTHPSLLSLACVHEPIKIFTFDVCGVQCDPGCRYHSDGSGTPPSEDIFEIETCKSIISTCQSVMNYYMSRRVQDAIEELEMKTI